MPNSSCRNYLTIIRLATHPVNPPWADADHLPEKGCLTALRMGSVNFAGLTGLASERSSGIVAKAPVAAGSQRGTEDSMSASPAITSLVPRFRWGNIAPRSNSALYIGPGYEFYRLVPLDVIELRTSLEIGDYTTDAIEAAITSYWSCVSLLQQEKADRMILGGAPVSARLGRARVRTLLEETEQKTGVPCDAPLEAVITSMQHLGCTRLALASRWSVDLNAAVARYLAEGGIDVVATTARSQAANEASAMSFDTGITLALDVGREAARASAQAEAVFVAGGAAMSLQVIPAVEAEFDLPVLTNLSAEVFTGLIEPGVIAPLEGWGRLLARS
jgi:maleate cis-trans isomerase